MMNVGALNDSLQVYQDSITQSEEKENSLSAPTARTPTPSEPVDIQVSSPVDQQKIWIITNGLIWLFIAIVSIPLLIEKQSNLHDFYDNSQCCYCLWVANHYDTRIEWAPCYATLHLNAHNLNQVCNIDGTQYCGATGTPHAKGTLSYKTAYFLPKYYVYYGLFAFGFVVIYLFLLYITTFRYKILLSGKLFIGNIIVTIICYYPYIKLYQFHRTDFDLCENPPPFKLGQSRHCYESAIDPVSNTLLDSLAYYLEFYMVYLVYVVYPCVCFIIIKCCYKLACCRTLGPILDNVFFYLSIFGAPVFVILSFVTLVYYVVVFDADFGLVGFASNKVEQTFIIIIGGLLLFTAFNMFLMRYCRRQTKDILCCTESQHQRHMTYHALIEDQLTIND